MNKTRFSKYNHKATKKNINFSINENEFYNICKDKCYICGIEPDNIKYFCGVDRIDSKLPYELNNCKACCKECNIMKNNFEIEYFKNKLKNIYDNIIKNNKYLENVKDCKTICNNTVLNKNINKLSKETKTLIKDYDDELKKRTTILTNTNKELQKIKIQEYSKKENIDNRNNEKVKNYIENIIKPKALEETKKYFESINSENPLISRKDNVQTIRDFEKKFKDNINNKEKEKERKRIYREKKALQSGKKIREYKFNRTEDEIRENRKIQQQLRRANKKKLDNIKNNIENNNIDSDDLDN